MPLEKDDPSSPPSYTDSLRPQLTSSTTSSASAPRGQSLLDTLTLTRATTVRTVIHSAILPLLESRASMGLPSTVLVLLPADIPLPPPPEKNEFSFAGYAGAEKAEDAVKVVRGEGVEEAVEVVRLRGDENSSAFWRLRAVVEELERGLWDVLNDGRIRSTPVVQEIKEAQQKKKKGFFGRRKEVDEGMGGKEADEVYGDRVKVAVKVEEICLRTSNEFGLYDTMNKQCVVVRVDAGC